MSIFDPLEPYRHAIKVGAAILAFAALAVLIGSWAARGLKIEQMENLQGQIVEAATEAVVEPDEDGYRELLEPDQVPAAIRALAASLKSADEALTDIATETEAAAAAGKQADSELAQRIDRMQDRARAAADREWNPWGD